MFLSLQFHYRQWLYSCLLLVWQLIGCEAQQSKDSPFTQPGVIVGIVVGVLGVLVVLGVSIVLCRLFCCKHSQGCCSCCGPEWKEASVMPPKDSSSSDSQPISVISNDRRPSRTRGSFRRSDRRFNPPEYDDLPQFNWSPRKNGKDLGATSDRPEPDSRSSSTAALYEDRNPRLPPIYGLKSKKRQGKTQVQHPEPENKEEEELESDSEEGERWDQRLRELAQEKIPPLRDSSENPEQRFTYCNYNFDTSLEDPSVEARMFGNSKLKIRPQPVEDEAETREAWTRSRSNEQVHQEELPPNTNSEDVPRFQNQSPSQQWNRSQERTYREDAEEEEDESFRWKSPPRRTIQQELADSLRMRAQQQQHSHPPISTETWDRSRRTEYPYDSRPLHNASTFGENPLRQEEAVGSYWDNARGTRQHQPHEEELDRSLAEGFEYGAHHAPGSSHQPSAFRVYTDPYKREAQTDCHETEV